MKTCLCLLFFAVSLCGLSQPKGNQLVGNSANRTGALSCNNWLSTPSQPSYVTIGDLDIPGNTITVEAVINRTIAYSGGLIYAGDIVSKHVGPSDVNYLLRPNTAEITTSNGYFRTPDICDIKLNTTYHVAMVYNGSTLKFYRNGYLMSQIAATGSLYQNNWPTMIGYYANQVINENFIGYINEVRIWNIARTQSEIKSYMNSSLPNPSSQTGLLAYYTFDNLLNKQGNQTWNGILGGSAKLNQSNTNCEFFADSCNKPASISNIINTYTPVIALNKCENKLTVEDASTFNIGDTVLLIQMKGAEIDSSNTPGFGTVTNFKNAGNYEYNFVKSKSSNVIELKNKLTRQYDIPNGKVQLIRVPYYNSINVTSTLTCLPWDGYKGGVLAMNVKEEINLSANIDVSGKGLKGGKANNPKNNSYYCHETDYYYPNDPIKAAPKGEAIAEISISKSYGRGALANGGGGGSEHNSGGAGGSNSSTGGNGGNEWVSCKPTINNGGIGGKPLSYSNTLNKIFLGGGGGAGHSDNIPGFNPNGGDGGGIIIIHSNFIRANGNSIIANGIGGVECIRNNEDFKCHEGMGGGGGGGAILLAVNNFIDNLSLNVNGGKGADMNGEIAGKLGPGGGGGGGVVWFSKNSFPGNVTVSNSGGINGVNIDFGKDSYGSTPGEAGAKLLNLIIPLDSDPFTPNIDSVKIQASALSCNSFDFKGKEFINSSAIAVWQWYFGDGKTANTQNTTHTYAASGTYTVKLVVIDVNGCKDSTSTIISSGGTGFDFSYKQDICDPLSVQFFDAGSGNTNSYWLFGDGTFANAISSPKHTYAAPGNYIVKYSIGNGCIDTIVKTISVNSLLQNIITTQDSTICAGSSKQLNSVPSLNFCWSPTTYLDDPKSANPVSSALQNITYYLNAEITGNNLITNGDFSNGNSGFTSEYNYASINITEGQYFVGTNPEAWNASLSNCKDHTTAGGNMLLVNGSPTLDVNVWKQTITVLPNTNYAFSTWIQALWPPNPAQLQFSINGQTIGNLITASLPTCTWTQFYTTWNSGNNTNATISIINKNTAIQGNDFALDDISFAPVFIKRDSVKITVDNPVVKTNNDTLVCSGSSLQLNTIGAASYSWTPAASLSNANIANPVATINTATTFVVSGVTANGCIGKDTLVVSLFAKPLIVTSNDTTICKTANVQLFASGGLSYLWSPASSLSSANIPNPVASPSSTTIYQIIVNDANSCSYKDSVKIIIGSLGVFSVSPDQSVCTNTPKQLFASGGSSYLWQPAMYLDDPNIANPVATVSNTIFYTVKIKDSTCNDSVTLSTTVNALPLPSIKAFKSNDIDCSNSLSQLNATGGNSYLWSPAAFLNNNKIPNPLATTTSTTLFMVSGTDINGCKNTDTITVFFNSNNKSGHYMPNAFTPNNDGVNDCFGLKYWGNVTKLEFNIYNRFGEIVFHTKNPTKCWDGKFKGILQETGIYVYVIKATTTCDIVNKKGTFSLLR